MSGRIVAIGECMVELAPVEGGLYRRGFAGDSFNTAWYLRRALPKSFDVDYVSAVGSDPLSAAMLSFMTDAGIGTGAVQRIEGASVGLYMISLANGERTFAYWRSQSAARRLARDPDALRVALAGAAMVYVTGITMAVVEPEDRQTLVDALEAAAAAGAAVVFDPNMRPRLWPDDDTMRHWVTRTAAAASIVMPSFEDESRHFGDADPAGTLARYHALGAGTVVVKDGDGEVLAWSEDAGEVRVAPQQVAVVDTTAAGDSFNAGFLAARLTGRPLPEAIAAGARLAGIVVCARGALVEEGTLGL